MKKYPLYFAMLFHALLASTFLQAQSVGHRVDGSPYPISNPPARVFLTSETFTLPEKVTLQTLQGITAKTKPEILRDAHDHKLIMQKAGIPIDETYYRNFPGLLRHFAPRIQGYILCNAKDKSTNVAISLAGLLNAVAVPVEVEQTAISARLVRTLDVRGRNENWVLDNYGTQFNKKLPVTSPAWTTG